jgi:leucyl/phenylalanyl-tRNA--protein transferase
MPIFELDINNNSFPRPEFANDDGLLAIGGDLSIDRLLNAYANGIFPWFNPDDPILWWSPNPRFVLYPNEFKAQKSLLQKMRNSSFDIKFDYDFHSIIKACATVKRKHEEGTWITNDMEQAYINLFAIGAAHCVGIYQENELIGGLYGVQIGTVFTGESMFSKKSDASKIALYNLCQNAGNFGFELIDVQMETEHLVRLGAKAIDRKTFIEYLSDSYKQTRFERWRAEKL